MEPTETITPTVRFAPRGWTEISNWIENASDILTHEFNQIMVYLPPETA